MAYPELSELTVTRVILVYVTCASGDEAWKIGHELLESKLAGCVVTFPVRSMYWWKNKVRETTEYVLLIKTRDTLFNRVKDMIEKLHSYETPCIIRIDCKGSRGYETWLQHVLK